MIATKILMSPVGALSDFQPSTANMRAYDLLAMVAVTLSSSIAALYYSYVCLISIILLGDGLNQERQV